MTEALNEFRRSALGLASQTKAAAGPRLGGVAKQRIMPISYARAVLGGTSRDESEFRAKMRGRFGTNTAIAPLGRARSGIYLLTKFAVGYGRRKVLMSPYTIPDVVTMVMLAGGEPVFFDFEPDSTACDLNHLESLIDDNTACVWITHQHVNEPRLAEIARLCRQRGAFVYDDCAIAFGGSIGVEPVGVATDASVFSFSSFKLLNFFWGGMITTRNRRISQFVDDEMKHWPRLSLNDYMGPMRACLKYDLGSRPLLFNLLLFPAFRRRARRSGAARSLDHLRLETTTLNASLTSRPSFAAFAEWNRKIGQIDRWLAQRRAIAATYWRLLGDHMVSAKTAGAVFNGSCFVNFPVIVPQERRDDICRALMLSGFDVGQSLYPNVHRHPKFAGLPGGSDNVDRLVSSSIYLPTHFGVSTAYAEAVAMCLTELAEIG